MALDQHGRAGPLDPAPHWQRRRGEGGENNRISKCETREGLKGKLIAITMLFDLLNLAQGGEGGGVLDPSSLKCITVHEALLVPVPHC